MPRIIQVALKNFTWKEKWPNSSVFNGNTQCCRPCIIMDQRSTAIFSSVISFLLPVYRFPLLCISEASYISLIQTK